jgi:hypothetical protein
MNDAIVLVCKSFCLARDSVCESIEQLMEGISMKDHTLSRLGNGWAVDFAVNKVTLCSAALRFRPGGRVCCRNLLAATCLVNETHVV